MINGISMVFLMVYLRLSIPYRQLASVKALSKFHFKAFRTILMFVIPFRLPFRKMENVSAGITHFLIEKKHQNIDVIVFFSIYRYRFFQMPQQPKFLFISFILTKT